MVKKQMLLDRIENLERRMKFKDIIIILILSITLLLTFQNYLQYSINDNFIKINELDHNIISRIIDIQEEDVRLLEVVANRFIKVEEKTDILMESLNPKQIARIKETQERALRYESCMERLYSMADTSKFRQIANPCERFR